MSDEAGDDRPTAMMDDSKVQRTSRRKQKRIRKERRQKRIIYAALGASVLASVVWLIAISTNGWVELILPDSGVYLPSLRDDAGGRLVLVVKVWAGLWKLCRVEYSHSSTADTATITASTDTEHLDEVKVKFCTGVSFYPSSEEQAARGLDDTILDYRRAVTAIVLIGLLVATTANAFTVYAIRRPRYVLRRLAGCLQLGAAACLLVGIEIFEGSLSYAQGNHLHLVYPPDTRHRVYGYSFGLAWSSFALFLLAGIALLIYSRKEKNTATDQPVILGRL